MLGSSTAPLGPNTVPANDESQTRPFKFPENAIMALLTYRLIDS